MEDGPSCVERPISGRGIVTEFRNFGTPNNFGTNRAIRLKFGTETEDGPLLHRDHKRKSQAYLTTVFENTYFMFFFSDFKKT